MRTEQEIKQICISKLYELIEDIKNDETSYNYSFRVDLLERITNPDFDLSLVRYSITRNEISFNEG